MCHLSDGREKIVAAMQKHQCPKVFRKFSRPNMATVLSICKSLMG
jgi:hypothetical protein